ncbi:hypothetical protein [Acidiphilium acidophilum]|nr:hypothetical protein [Acidiphilium acidophilum]
MDLFPVMEIPVTDAKTRLTALIRRARQEPGAARSQDFLYGDDTIPA